MARRRLVLYILMGAALFALVVEIVMLLPRVLEVWHPYDYWQYTQMGAAVLQGREPLGPGRYYPLPTVIWIFAPLSLMPDWFRLIWILAPFVSILILFRLHGIWLFLFTPLWFSVTDATLEGWLLIPLRWLLENRPGWAGLAAVAMLIKPQLATLLVVYALGLWLATRDWKNLAVFVVALTVFCLPAFIVNPGWPLQLLEVLPLRAQETFVFLPLLTASIWSWWWLGDRARVIFLILFAIALGLFVRAMFHISARAAAWHLINLALNPILFGASMIMIAPVLRERRHILISVAMSLGAFALDKQMGGFGGGYALISLAVLYFQTRC